MILATIVNSTTHEFWKSGSGRDVCQSGAVEHKELQSLSGAFEGQWDS